jgi:hypothetical protein
MSKASIAGVAVAVVLSAASRTDAQLAMKLRFEHRRTLRFEAVNAFVTVVNEGATPVVFGDKGAKMSFVVEKERDVRAQSRNERLLWRDLELAPGRKREFLHDLSLIYDLSAIGTYAVTAVIEWRGAVFQSNRIRVDVVNGLPIRSERKLFTGPGGDFVRVLGLRYLARAGSEHLFFTVMDDELATSYGVFDLGQIIRLHAPAIRVQRTGGTRVLHQSGVGRYTLSHLDISPSRVTFRDQEYRRGDGSPFTTPPEKAVPAGPRTTEKPGRRRFFLFGPRVSE